MLLFVVFCCITGPRLGEDGRKDPSGVSCPLMGRNRVPKAMMMEDPEEEDQKVDSVSGGWIMSWTRPDKDGYPILGEKRHRTFCSGELL